MLKIGLCLVLSFRRSFNNRAAASLATRHFLGRGFAFLTFLREPSCKSEKKIETVLGCAGSLNGPARDIRKGESGSGMRVAVWNPGWSLGAGARQLGNEAKTQDARPQREGGGARGVLVSSDVRVWKLESRGRALERRRGTGWSGGGGAGRRAARRGVESGSTWG